MIVLMPLAWCIIGAFYIGMLMIEAAGVGQWIATSICFIIIFVINFIERFHQKWHWQVFFSMVGIFGTIQSLILATMDMPAYYKDKGMVILLSSYGWQTIVCLVCEGISVIPERIIQNKINKLMFAIRSKLNEYIYTLNRIEELMATTELSYKQSESLIALFKYNGNEDLVIAYNNARIRKDAKIVEKINEILFESEINIDTRGKTLEMINHEVIERKKKIEKTLDEISNNKYTVLDYKRLKHNYRTFLKI